MPRVPGANDRVQVGFIGYGLIGSQHVHDFKTLNDVDLVAMCEVYRPRLEQGAAACGPRTKAYKDFRRLLDDKDIQAVVISTPDHWHAPLTMLACSAGKDVYVEKPMTLFVAEGRWLAAAQWHSLPERTEAAAGWLYRKSSHRADGFLSQRHAGIRLACGFRSS